MVELLYIQQYKRPSLPLKYTRMACAIFIRETSISTFPHVDPRYPSLIRKVGIVPLQDATWSTKADSPGAAEGRVCKDLFPLEVSNVVDEVLIIICRL